MPTDRPDDAWEYSPSWGGGWSWGCRNERTISLICRNLISDLSEITTDVTVDSQGVLVVLVMLSQGLMVGCLELWVGELYRLLMEIRWHHVVCGLVLHTARGRILGHKGFPILLYEDIIYEFHYSSKTDKFTCVFCWGRWWRCVSSWAE